MNTDIQKKNTKFDSLALLACSLVVLVSNVYIITTMYNELNANIGLNLVSLDYVYTYLLFCILIKMHFWAYSVVDSHILNL